MPGDLDAFSQMAQGLLYMHSKNLFHGALKPANVSVTLRSSIIPQIILKVSQDSLMTWSKGFVPHNMIGIDSYIYWPPEWLEILEYEEYQVPVPAAAADIFALGCLFYGYITKGGHPFGKGVFTLSNILNSKHDLSGT
jgi:serine/threonine protein kinase